MKKLFLTVLFLASVIFSQTWPPVTNFTYYWIPAAGDTVTFAKWKANNDSVKAGAQRVINELNTNAVHFNQGTVNHDSVVHYVNIDTIRSNPDIDSLHGNPWIDTVTTSLVVVDSIEFDGYATKFNVSYESSVVCSVFDGSDFLETAAATLYKAGSRITLRLGETGGGTISADSTTYLKVPAEYRPAVAQYIPARIYNNGAFEIGLIYIPASGHFSITQSDGSLLTAAANGGIAIGSTITYLKLN